MNTIDVMVLLDLVFMEEHKLDKWEPIGVMIVKKKKKKKHK